MSLNNTMVGKKRNQDRIDENLLDKKEEGELIVGDIGSFDNKSDRNAMRRDQKAHEKNRDKDRERDKDTSYDINNFSKSFNDDKADRGYAKYRDNNNYPQNRNDFYRKEKKTILQRKRTANERYYDNSDEYIPSNPRAREDYKDTRDVQYRVRDRINDRSKQHEYENDREKDRELRYKDREREREMVHEEREKERPPRDQLTREGRAIRHNNHLTRVEQVQSSIHRSHERSFSPSEDEDEEDSLKMKDRKRIKRTNSWERREREDREDRELKYERSNIRINRRQPKRLINTQLKKKFNFLIVLQKNYFRFIEDHFSSLSREIKSKVRDIELLQYDYSVPNYQDYIFRIEAPRISSKAQIMRIVCDFLFRQMKMTYKHMTYLKVSILIPAHVVGFVIGIEGKNINSIRDSSGARIDIFQQDIHNGYRQIELAGSPLTIARATEKIYKIVNKYYFFNQNNYGESDDEMGNAPKEKRRIRLIKRKSHSSSRTKRIKKKDNLEEKLHSKSKSPIEKKKVNEAPISLHFSLKSTECIPKPKEASDKIIPQDDLLTPINHLIPQTSTESVIPSKIETEVKPEIDYDIRNIQQSFTSTFSASNISSQNEKISLDVVIPNESLNLLKKFRSNIYIDMENKYHCTICKKVEKISNEDVNIVTFNGTPEENSLALYHLQKYILDLMQKNVKV